MPRLRPRTTTALLAAAVLLAVPACSSQTETANPATPPADAPTPGDTLLGTVGTPDDPDEFVIALTDEDGTAVTTLPAGAYTIEVSDPSRMHNFAITGEGVDEATSVPETGSTTFEVTLVAGEYTYICDPHSSMVGTITVV